MRINYRNYWRQILVIILVLVGMPLSLLQLGDIWLQIKGGALYTFLIAYGITHLPFKLRPQVSAVIQVISFIIGIVLTGLLIWYRQSTGFEMIELMVIGIIAFARVVEGYSPRSQ